jgi:NMT1-like family
MLSRTGRLLAVVLTISLLVISTQAHAQGKKEVVKLGYVPVLIYAPLYVATERGYFADEGIEVQLTPLQGGSDSVVQLAAARHCRQRRLAKRRGAVNSATVLGNPHKGHLDASWSDWFDGLTISHAVADLTP